MGAAQHYTHVPGVAHWASIKQASALVREGDTHPPKEKGKKGKGELIVGHFEWVSGPHVAHRLQVVLICHKPSWYVINHTGQLSLVIPPWEGTTAMTTSEMWTVNRHTTPCSSPVSVVLQHKLVSGWDTEINTALWAGPRTLGQFVFLVVLLVLSSIRISLSHKTCSVNATVCWTIFVPNYISFLQQVSALFSLTSCLTASWFYHSSRVWLLKCIYSVLQSFSSTQFTSTF